MSIYSYRDNNNFLRLNKDDYSYTRWLFWESNDDATFLDLHSNPPYTTGPSIINYAISRDKNKSYKIEKLQRLYGTWFFLSPLVVSHSYDPYTLF